MGRARRLIFGGVIGAAVGVVIAPRLGESRQVALDRLRLAIRRGRGSLTAFSGTPCAAACRAATGAGERAADSACGTKGADDDE